MLYERPYADGRVLNVSIEKQGSCRPEPHSLGLLNSLSLLQPDRIVESAWLQHIPFAFWLISILKPLKVVELGVHRGASLTAFCQAVKECELKTEVIGVDTWEGDAHTGEYGSEILNELAEYVSRYRFPVRLLRKTFTEALTDVEDASVDLLHIDGFHTYAAVEEDFRTWIPKLSRRGIILFHDVNVYERDFGVHKLWREVSGKFPCFEFLHGHGLGVLAVGSEIPEQLQELFKARDNHQMTDAIRAAYHTLGLAISRTFEISLRLDTELTDTKMLRYIVSPEGTNFESIRARLIEFEQRANELFARNKELETEHDLLVDRISTLSQEVDGAQVQRRRRKIIGRTTLPENS